MLDNTLVMCKIDEAAASFHRTQDEKYFNVFVHLASPIIRMHVNKTCRESYWDKDDLYSILLADMWRLFKCYSPQVDKRFHWLMLRQLRNKVINFVYTQMGRRRTICPVCGERQPEGGSNVCVECSSSLCIPTNVVGREELFGSVCSYFPDYLSEIANKDIVSKLLEKVKEDKDDKTYRILEMLLEGESKSKIGREVSLAQNAINRRIKKCRGIVTQMLLVDKYSKGE